MKKFRIFIAILVTILIACCFISAKPKSFLSSANAQTTSTTSNVTFYGEDRTTPLLNIPDWQNGLNLFNYDAGNIIQDSTFNSFTGGTYTASVAYDAIDLSEYWKIQINTIGATVDLTKNNGLLYYSKDATKTYNYLSYRMPNNINGTYYFRVSINGIEFSSSITTNFDFNVNYQGGMSRYADFDTYRVGYGLEHNYNNFKFVIGLSNLYEEVSFTIDYVYVGFENSNYYSYDYLKRLYFENQNTYENIDDFDLLFTNDYYNYTQYFNGNYIVSKSVNFYPKLLKVNYKQPQDYEITAGDDIFASTGQNLLNSINQDAISFDPVYFAFGANIEAQTGYIILDKIINGFSLGDNFSIYNDNLGNLWYFNTFVSSYGDNFQYLFYLYDYKINNFNFVVPVFDYDKMILSYNNGYKLFGDATLINYNLVGSFEFEFDINYNMQFYYADYMGVSLNITNYFKPVGGGVQIRFLDKQGRIFVENFDDVYSEYLLKTPYLKNSLINSVNFTIGLRSAMSQGFNNSSTYTSKIDAFSYLNGLSININYNDMKLYFYNVESSSNASAIIPTTSDGLYKEKEHWYDFTTDLYNFVIYICFDAPFISNITQLLYVIISLIKKLFDLIIALFTTSNSTIFIAIFFGFFLLKMILNKVIGGKE